MDVSFYLSLTYETTLTNKTKVAWNNISISTWWMHISLIKAIFGFTCRITMTLISPHHFSEIELLLLVGIAIADISKVFLWVGSWHIGSFYPSCKSPRSEPKSHHSNKTNKKWTQHSDQIPLVSQWNVILALSKKIVQKGVQYKGQYKL